MTAAFGCRLAFHVQSWVAYTKVSVTHHGRKSVVKCGMSNVECETFHHVSRLSWTHFNNHAARLAKRHARKPPLDAKHGSKYSVELDVTERASRRSTWKSREPPIQTSSCTVCTCTGTTVLSGSLLEGGNWMALRF